MKTTISLRTLTPKASSILVGSVAAILAVQSAQATDLYWDTNDTGANAGTTAGVWGTSAFWYTDSTGGGSGGGIIPTTADDNLFFSAGTNTGATGLLNNITLAAGNWFANKITFDDPLAAATNLTLSGATSLTLGGGAGSNTGIYVSYAASSGFANRILFSQALTLGANATFQNDSPSNTINFGGGVTGAFNVTLKNNSTRWGGISVQGGLNNGGTVTNSGTGSGDAEVYGLIGTNVLGVIQDSLTSVLSVSQANSYTGQTTLKAGIMRMTGSVIAATGPGAFGNGGTIMFDGGIMQLCGGGTISDASARFNVTAGKDYKIDLHIQGNNIASLRNMTIGTTLAVSGGAGNTNGLRKFGLATLTLTAAQTYKGTTTIGGIESAGNQTFRGGIIQIGSGGAGSTGSLDSASSVAFAGTGTINFTEAMNVNQSLATLTFTAGDGTLVSTNNTGTSFLTFTTLAARGSSGIMNFLTTNGTNGTDNKIVLNSVTANSFIDKGAFYSNTAAGAAANAYAWYDAGGYVRAINYTSPDTGAVTSGATTSVASATHQQITGALSAQGSATFTTLNIKGGSDINLATGATLTSGSIFKSGGTASAINGGTGIAAPNNQPIIIRTDDSLTINTPILADGTNDLVKSGTANLRLAGAINYTGNTAINDGILVLASPTDRTYGGVISGGGGVAFSGPSTTTLNGSQPNTFTGTLVVTGGTNLVLDFANMATPEQMIPQGIETNHTNNGTLQNQLGQGSPTQGTQGEGSITIIGKAGANSTVQKFGNKGNGGSPGRSFVLFGTGKILVNPNGGTETLVDIGCTQTNAGTSLLIGKTASAGSGDVVFTSYRSVGNTEGNGNSSMGRLYFTTDGGTTVYHTNHSAGGDVNASAGQFNRELPMETTLGGTAYGTVTTGGAGGYAKLTGAAIATAGGTFTMTGGFTGSGRSSFYKIESPQAGQILAMTGDNNFGFGGLLIDGSGSGTFTISGGKIVSENTGQANICYFAQFSSLDVNITSDISSTDGNANTVNTGGIAKFGDGRLILSNANTYAGTSRLTDGILQVNATNTAGTSGPLGASGTIQFSGGVLQYGPSSGSFDYSSRFSTSEQSPFKIDTNGLNVTFASALGGSTVSTLTKLGSGTLTLTAASNYTGLTTVGGGTLKLGISNAIKSGNAVTVSATAAGTATLDLAGFNQTIGGAGLTLGGATTSSVASVTDSGGTSILTLSGGGTAVTYNAANNPLGATISATTISLADAPQIFTVGDSSTVTGSGNELTISSNITQVGALTALVKAGTGALKLDGTQGYDILTVNDGTANVNGILGTAPGLAVVSVTNTAGGAATKLRFGTVSQTLSSLTIGAGATVVFTSGPASGSFSGGGGGKAPSFGGGAVVPEPGTLGLLLVGALGVLHRRRRV